MFQNRPQECPKSLKIDLWCCLGALWGPSWRQDGAKAATRPGKHKKYQILESPWGSKIQPKSIKVWIEKIFFGKDLGYDFARPWNDFGTQNLSKIKVLWKVFFDLVGDMRKV